MLYLLTGDGVELGNYDAELPRDSHCPLVSLIDKAKWEPEPFLAIPMGYWRMVRLTAIVDVRALGSFISQGAGRGNADPEESRNTWRYNSAGAL